MGKTRFSGRDIDQLQRLKQENSALRRSVQQLRRQLSRLDLDRYTTVKELIEAAEASVGTADRKPHIDQIKKMWECFECRDDYLRLVTFERRDGTWYYRRCPNCSHKTKLQRLTEDVDPGVKWGEKE